MKKSDIYWQTYLNLEKELLEVSKYIFITDEITVVKDGKATTQPYKSQLETFSPHIADLLVRCCVQIEAISKELYYELNGEKERGDTSIKFDEDCLKLIDKEWATHKKVVLVVAPTFNLTEDDNLVLRPLNKAHEWQGCYWGRCYQAVKHDRYRSLAKGNIKALIQAMAALYLLNLYLRNVAIENVDVEKAHSTDCSFGSSVFAVKLHKISGLSANGAYFLGDDYDECAYIEDYEEKSKKAGLKAWEETNSKFADALMEIVVEKMNQEIAEGKDVDFSQKAVLERFEEVKKEPESYSRAVKKMPKGILSPLVGLKYNVVLNKNQYKQIEGHYG